jgi:hypothetical protein
MNLVGRDGLHIHLTFSPWQCRANGLAPDTSDAKSAKRNLSSPGAFLARSGRCILRCYPRLQRVFSLALCGFDVLRTARQPLENRHEKSTTWFCFLSDLSALSV